ncbi:MFS general substrate transporter [Pterulicium gracile]|uniref:MFS general substrate transporter n=1 Tax=Pterulicium gracile TaxID=1884261 RepID=A0A5C3QKP2_9AGAR|nr:MFS general substrate transporter [Pterula gracilis]
MTTLTLSTSSTPTEVASAPAPKSTRPRPCPRESSRQGVLSAIGAFLALLCTFGQMNAFGAFLAYYKDHQLASYSSAVISWIGSIQLFVFFVSGIPVGILFDKYGPRLPIVLGSVIHVLSMVLTSVSTKYWHLVLTHGFLFGLGVALVFYPCVAAVSSHFHRRRAAALGFVLAGSGIGGVIYPIAFHILFLTLQFGWSVRICAGVSALLCLVACFTVTSADETVTVDVEREGKFAWAMDGLKDRVYVSLIVGNLFVSLGIFIPYFFISSYTVTLPTPRSTLCLYTLSIMNASGVLGRFFLSLLADSLGPFTLLALSSLSMGIFTLTLWLLSENSVVLVILYAVAYGFCSGGFIALINPCVAGISEVRVMGRRIGGLYTLVAFPALVGNPLGAFLLDRSGGSYRSMIIFSGAVMVVGSTVLILSRWQRSEGRFRVVV